MLGKEPNVSVLIISLLTIAFFVVLGLPFCVACSFGLFLIKKSKKSKAVMPDL